MNALSHSPGRPPAAFARNSSGFSLKARAPAGGPIIWAARELIVRAPSLPADMRPLGPAQLGPSEAAKLGPHLFLSLSLSALASTFSSASASASASSGEQGAKCQLGAISGGSGWRASQQRGSAASDCVSRQAGNQLVALLCVCTRLEELSRQGGNNNNLRRRPSRLEMSPRAGAHKLSERPRSPARRPPADWPHARAPIKLLADRPADEHLAASNRRPDKRRRPSITPSGVASRRKQCCGGGGGPTSVRPAGTRTCCFARRACRFQAAGVHPRRPVG